MRPVFSFMGWRVLDPEQNDSFGALGDAECQRAICPEPTCLREWDNNPYQGKIVTTGEKGRASLRARPCNRHQDTFEFTPGWYQRFADAYYAEPATPRSCTECGRPHTTHLWEHAWDLCVPCTHEGIGYMRRIDLRTNTMEFGRRLGLDEKAWGVQPAPQGEAGGKTAGAAGLHPAGQPGMGSSRGRPQRVPGPLRGVPPAADQRGSHGNGRRTRVRLHRLA